jgi:hypothetical protein
MARQHVVATRASRCVAAEATALFDPAVQILSKPLALAAIFPADEEDLVVAVGRVADDGDDRAS